MEENSELQMDTDVSSTTSYLPDTRQATGIHGNVQTVIVVEEVKEEDLNNYIASEASPMKSKDSNEAVSTPTLSPEKDQSKNIVNSPNKDVQIVDLTNQETPTELASEVSSMKSKDSNEAVLTPTHSPERNQSKKMVNSPNKDVQIVDLINQKTPTKSVELIYTPTESVQDLKTPQSELMQKTPKKLEQVQKTPIKIVQVAKSSAQSEHMQNTPAKSEHVPKTPNKSVLVQKTPAISEHKQNALPESEQMQKTSVMTEKVSSKLEPVKKLHTNSEYQMMSDQMPKTPAEQAHNKLDQVLESPTNSDQTPQTWCRWHPDARCQMPEITTKEVQTEQAQKTTIPEVHKTMDQLEKIEGPNISKISPIKSLEQPKSKEIIDITDDEVVVKPLKELEAVPEKSTKETKQTKESVEEQSKKTPAKLDLSNKSDSHSNKSEKSSVNEKSSITESLDKDNSKMDCSESAEQIKECTNKVKRDKKDKKKEDAVSTTPVDICEKSNDSQVDTNSDVSEKEHNKSISRELKSLINSAKESKIISECTQLTSKTRKSRAAADSANTSLNTSVEADKIQNVRRSSVNSQKSNASEKSEKAPLKRSMRSQNPDFVNKVKLFLNSVTGKNQKDEDEEENDGRKKENHSESSSPSPKKKKLTESQQHDAAEEQSNRLHSDLYCWRCHWAVEQAANEKGHPPLLCTVCPRSFHYKCLTGTERSKTMTVKGWICPECMNVLHAESSETQSLAMKKLNHPRLCELLQYAWDRMIDLNGVEPFMNPVDRTAFPDYDKYVVHPMDLSLMKTNILQGNYGSTEAFLADAQWILHNSVIFNTCMSKMQSKLTGAARTLVRSCRAEMGEIEACPECYAAAHARRLTWFTDVCSTPHILLWAKLKGFPYWPAKGMSVNAQGLVDVRFFGAHDRAWVPARDCFLYCQKDPNNFKAKRLDILESMQEAEDHIRNISRKYGKFVYPAFKTPFDPAKLGEQLKMMIPTFNGEVSALVKEKPLTSSPSAAKVKSRSNSKSSKTSANECDASENEEAKTTTPRKIAAGAEIAPEKNEVAAEKNTPMEIDQIVPNKEKESARKRRRSGLEEAVITIITTSSLSSEKKKKVEHEKVKDDNKTESTQEDSRKVEETLPNSNIIEKIIEKAVNKVKEVPITATISKERDKAVPTSEGEKSQVVTSTPVKLTPKGKPTKTSTPKEREEKTSTPKQKPVKPDKSSQIENEKQVESVLKSPKPRTKSRNRSLNNSQVKDNEEKTADKHSNNKDSTSNNNTKDKVKESNLVSAKDKETAAEKSIEKAVETKTNATDSPKPTEDRSHLDEDDTSLAVIARETAKKSFPGLPTITSVRSLSTAQTTSTVTKTTADPKITTTVTKTTADPRNSTVTKTTADPKTTSTVTKTTADPKTTSTVTKTTADPKTSTVTKTTAEPKTSTVTKTIADPKTTSTVTKTTADPKTVEITVSAHSAMNVFTPTSTDNVRNMKEAVDKLQKLRNETDKPIGRVGVRSFARMTSPPAPPEKEKQTDTVEVEVKSEPIDFDDADRQVEKMDLMRAFHLRPVNPTTVATLRDVRINKVVVAPAKKATMKTTEVRIRARKTFPTPRKDSNEARSELNGKNSMVYIPIQPPTTQAPTLRPTRPIVNGVFGVNTQAVRPQAPASMANSLVNNQTTPLASVPMTTTLAMATPKPANTIATNSHSNAICVPSVGQLPTIGQVCQVPTVGQIPNTVHTVPLITSVNGQWTFSLQPMMSVGGDGAASPPVVNGLPERGPPFGPVAPPNPLALHPLTNNNNANNNNTGTNNNETTPVELPRLQQRPPLANPFDASAPAGCVPAPSTAGPLTAKLNQNAVKLADFFRTLLEDTLEKIDDPQSQATLLKAQLEQAKWQHQQELNELRHTHELLATELRVAFEKDKARALGEMRRVAQVELEAAVKAAKTKQWCANCSQEAQFYCCWNTSYCDHSCQRSHWSQHFAVCTQQRNTDNNANENGNSLDKRLQPAPENLPRSVAAPPLAVGTKLTPTRVYAQDAHPQKTSIIVSMVEDHSGNQMVKCVGTYKPPGTQQGSQQVPLIINKQLMSNDENAAKKVMTSGGYLIVGAGSNAPLATNRRTHPVQYSYNT